MATPLADMKAFFRFLDQANDKELKAKHDALLRFYTEHSRNQIAASVKRLPRQIEEEMLTRKIIQVIE